MKYLCFCLFILLISCSRLKRRDTIQDLEDRLLKDGRISKAPLKDTFLEEENYVGPVSDQLNPLADEKEIELFNTESLEHDKTDYKEEFASLETIIKNKEEFNDLKDGNYDIKKNEPYEDILTIEKLSLSDAKNSKDGIFLQNEALEHDWQKGKEGLSQVLDVAPLSESELRNFLAKGRIKRKPELKISNYHLIRAAYNGSLESLKYLLTKGLDVETSNRRGDTPLIIAIKKDRYEMTKYLLEVGADRYKKNKKGHSASDLAKKKKDNRFAELFR